MTKAKPIRVLGIVGSPRKGGNTDLLVDEILRGAREAGAEVEKVTLADLEIGPCMACYACSKDGECIQKDDMADLFDRMQASAVWVIGTPVYWWGPSAQLKAFMDRWLSKASGGKEKEMFEGRCVVLAVPMGDTDPRTGRHVVGMFEDALAYVKADLFAAVLAPGAYDKGEVSKDTKVMEEARRIGTEAVKQ